MDVVTAIETRRSVRGYLNTPVSKAEVEAVLRLASRAPSATNTQPWRVFACAGAAKDALVAATMKAHAEDRDLHSSERAFYPDPLPEPYISRRRKLALSLYAHVGIEPGDRAASAKQFALNYTLFGAPVGLFLFLDKTLLQGSWLDMGLFIQTVMLAARAQGLDTCPQACWAPYHDVIRAQLGVPEDLTFACTIALGHADPDAPANALRSEREPVEVFTEFKGFE